MRTKLRHIARTKPYAASAVVALILFIVVSPVIALATAPSFTEYQIPGPTGAPNGKQPLSITKGPDGNVWFVEGIGNGIGRISTSGLISQYTLPVVGVQPSSPAGLIVGPDGNLWFADEGTRKISKMTTGFQLTEYPLPSNLIQPDSVAFGPDGNVWFTAYNSNIIGVMSVTGVMLHQYPSGGNGPEGISKGPDGNMWYTNQNSPSVAKINPSTGVVTTYSVASAPLGTAPGPDGNVYATEIGGQIARIVPSTGQVTSYAVTGGSPTNITAGPDGNMWFNVGYLGIGKLDLSNGVISEYSTPSASVGGAWGITTGPDNKIWYTVPYGRIGKADIGIAPPASPTPTLTPTPTPTHTATPTPTQTPSPTPAPLNSASPIPSISVQPSIAPTPTPTPIGTKTDPNLPGVVITIMEGGTTRAVVTTGMNLSKKDYQVPAGQTLVVDGKLGIVGVSNGGVLKGVGSLGNLVVAKGATLAPGHSPGCIGTNDFTMNGTYQVQIGGPTVCGGYNQVTTTGAVVLSGALDIQLVGNYAPKAGEIFTIIKNTAGLLITGTLSGLKEGDIVLSGNTAYALSYKGGSGHDVTLTAMTKDAAMSAVSTPGNVTQHISTEAVDLLMQNEGLEAAVFIALLAVAGTTVYILRTVKHPQPAPAAEAPKEDTKIVS